MNRLALWAAVVAVTLGVGLPSPAGAQTAPPPAPLPCGTGDCTQVMDYLRALPPDVLIRIAFQDTPHTERMLTIACRESGLGKTRRGCDPSVRVPAPPFAHACSAANPSSSARGLFQTLTGWSGLAAQHGLSWDRVVGPDCLDDVLLARAIYARSGLGPWT